MERTIKTIGSDIIMTDESTYYDRKGRSEKAVFKYPLPVNSEIALDLPKHAKVLTVQEQYGKPALWALVDLDMVKNNINETRTFIYVGTGQQHPPAFWNGLVYIGTFQQLKGNAVWHVFERPRIEWETLR